MKVLLHAAVFAGGFLAGYLVYFPKHEPAKLVEPPLPSGWNFYVEDRGWRQFQCDCGFDWLKTGRILHGAGFSGSGIMGDRMFQIMKDGEWASLDTKINQALVEIRETCK